MFKFLLLKFSTFLSLLFTLILLNVKGFIYLSLLFSVFSILFSYSFFCVLFFFIESSILFNDLYIFFSFLRELWALSDFTVDKFEFFLNNFFFFVLNDLL